MAAETFGALWQRVAVQVSAAPPLLCRAWVLEAYRRACTGRRWSFLRREIRYASQALREVSATASQGSALLLGPFLAADVGRQARGAGRQGVPYTVDAVDPGVSATLNGPWVLPSGAESFQVFDGFLALPADFEGFQTVTNLTVQREIPWWIPLDVLNQRNPNRIWQDTTGRALFLRGLGEAGGIHDGRYRAEWFPYLSGVGAYDVTYFAQPDPVDDDRLEGPLAPRAVILVYGALSEAAKYPGTPERRNPYFNLALADRLEGQFQAGLQELSTLDDDLVPGSQYNAVDWRWVNELIPWGSSQDLRASDASVGAFYGGGGWGYY